MKISTNGDLSDDLGRFLYSDFRINIFTENSFAFSTIVGAKKVRKAKDGTNSEVRVIIKPYEGEAELNYIGEFPIVDELKEFLKNYEAKLVDYKAKQIRKLEEALEKVNPVGSPLKDFELKL